MLVWQELKCSGPFASAHRAKVPGGWLVFVVRSSEQSGLTFYPDPSHSWDGSSM